MAQLQLNTFTSFVLTEDEEKQGSMFTIDQKRVLQNLLVTYAEAGRAIDYSPDKILEFVQQDYFNKGAVAVLKHLISTSDDLQQLDTIILVPNL